MVASNHGFPPDALPAQPSRPRQVFVVVLAVGLCALTAAAVVDAVQKRDVLVLVTAPVLLLTVASEVVHAMDRVAIAADGLYVRRPVGSFHAAIRRVGTTAVPGRLRLSLVGRRFAYNVHPPMFTNGDEFLQALRDHAVRHDIPTRGLEQSHDDA
jgi:hypothetical protein